MKELQHRINALQSRQLELRAIMASSDERASKCMKTGVSFHETYPQDFARYEEANAEYNRNELTLAELEAEREAQQEEEAGLWRDASADEKAAYDARMAERYPAPPEPESVDPDFFVNI